MAPGIFMKRKIRAVPYIHVALREQRHDFFRRKKRRFF